MHVAVLGGGLQGCSVALALADKGVKVCIYDKNEKLLSKAAIANEGKIHLGYMYAGDPSLNTAKMMMRGAMAFEPFFKRHLGQLAQPLSTSLAATYVVHRETQVSAEKVCAYLHTVHELVQKSTAEREWSYFGQDLRADLRAWSTAELEEHFDPSFALSALSTPEVAIDPVALAEGVRDCVETHPLIEVRCDSPVRSAKEQDKGIRVIGEDGMFSDGPFDHVVNALWDGRIAFNEASGFSTRRAWLHRLKYGLSFRLPADVTPKVSATFVLGPFGEVVSYRNGTVYLTWYPECLHGMSKDVKPPEWPTNPPEPLSSRIRKGTLGALAAIVPSLNDLDPEDLQDACVKGGVIVAWGKTDIYDPVSELHRRFEIGISSEGNFHSIDPGKLTMAPFFAEVCAERISPTV